MIMKLRGKFSRGTMRYQLLPADVSRRATEKTFFLIDGISECTLAQLEQDRSRRFSVVDRDHGHNVLAALEPG